MKTILTLIIAAIISASCTTQKKPIYRVEKLLVEKCENGYPVLKKLNVTRYPQVGDTIYRLIRVEPRF